jgi:hypothetical protein
MIIINYYRINSLKTNKILDFFEIARFEERQNVVKGSAGAGLRQWAAGFQLLFQVKGKRDLRDLRTLCTAANVRTFRSRFMPLALGSPLDRAGKAVHRIIGFLRTQPKIDIASSNELRN